MTSGQTTAPIRRDPGGHLDRPSRWPITAVFFLNGLVCASYIVSLPALKASHRLQDGQIGVVSLVFALAALGSMQFIGRLITRIGSGLVLRISLGLLPFLLVAVGRAPSFGTLVVTVAVFGVVHGATDGAMNAYAVNVERLRSQRLLNGCHAAWSSSAVLASIALGALTGAGLNVGVRLELLAALGLALGLAAGRYLQAGSVHRQEGADRGTSLRWSSGWSRTVVVLGLTATVLMVCEGGMLGWGSLLLHDARGASLALSAGAVTGYALGQTAGRLIGDRLATRYGARVVFAAGGTVGTLGLAVAILHPQPVAAVLGFAAAGAGLSVLMPLLVSEIGRTAGDGPAAAVLVPRFTSFAYAGILLGPGLIGWGADLVGLVATMSALIPLLALITLTTRLRNDEVTGH